MWFSRQALLIFLSFLTITACSSNAASISQDLENMLKNMTTQYIQAEYAGNKEVLLDLTEGEAKKAVEENQLDIFKGQKLEKIVEMKITKISDIEYQVIATVSSAVTEKDQLTNYFENLTISKVNNEWLITKINRDQ
jgi:hypothetical protein